MSILASSDNFLPLKTLGVYAFQRNRQFLSYGCAPVPSRPDQRGSTLLSSIRTWSV